MLQALDRSRACAPVGFQRHDRQAVRLHAAVAAALADGIVDEDALGRIDENAALAAPALLGGAGLVVDQHGAALGLAQFALHGVELVAMREGNAGKLRQAGFAVAFRLVGHQRDALDALGAQLRDDSLHGELAVERLAAGHRHGVVVENLVGDVDAGRDRGANRQQAGVEVGAVAEVLEHVLASR